MTDINVGTITEALNNKVDLPTPSTPQDAVDYVVEKQDPTSANGTWYRKYKSGWVEQGCHSVYQGATWTLPIPMADDNYTLVASYVDSASENTPHWQFMGIQQYSTYVIPKASGLAQRIYICGMAA